MFNPEKLRKSGDAMEYIVQEIETLARHHQGLGIIGSIEECVNELKSYHPFLKGSCSEKKFGEVIFDLCTNSITHTLSQYEHNGQYLQGDTHTHCRCGTHVHSPN